MACASSPRGLGHKRWRSRCAGTARNGPRIAGMARSGSSVNCPRTSRWTSPADASVHRDGLSGPAREHCLQRGDLLVGGRLERAARLRAPVRLQQTPRPGCPCPANHAQRAGADDWSALTKTAVSRRSCIRRLGQTLGRIPRPMHEAHSLERAGIRAIRSATAERPRSHVSRFVPERTPELPSQHGSS